jgi:acyl-CoA dehydrogenase
LILEGLKPEDERFRAEVQAFLRAELTPELIAGADAHESLFPPPTVTLPWQAKLRARGWLGLHWPREYGGAGLSALQRYLLETEALRAGAPLLAPFGLNYLGPILIRFGTNAQRTRFLPRILSGEDYWCQGYSEPNAGSDLVSLQCAARREGDQYVVDGSKLWTTHAQHANWIFLLVRTSNAGKPHSGISFLLVDLRSPGVSVAPIVSIAGEHEVNQVFFDGVRVPAEQLVGGEGEGWTIARYLLEFERGGFVMNGLLARKLERCRALLSPAVAAASASEAGALRACLAQLEVDLLALAAAELRVALSFETGSSPGPEAMVLKVEFTELMQRIESFGVALLGQGALRFAGHESADAIDAGTGRDVIAQALLGSYLNNRAATIYGGSSEIQRDIVARTVLGR